MAALALADWLIVIAYLGLMVGLGIYLARSSGSFEDFFLAGRGLTTPILIATLVSSYY